MGREGACGAGGPWLFDKFYIFELLSEDDDG